jgi:hypothetical protein
MEKNVEALTVRGVGEKRTPHINKSVRLVEVRLVSLIEEPN